MSGLGCAGRPIVQPSRGMATREEPKSDLGTAADSLPSESLLDPLRSPWLSKEHKMCPFSVAPDGQLSGL